MSRRANGVGTIYKRKDGRWEGAVSVLAVSGESKRIRGIYGKTAKEVSDKLAVKIADAQRGVPVSDKSWRIGPYLDYYLANVAPKKLAPRTVELYESLIRVHLKPMLGSRSLTELTVTGLQRLIDERLDKGVTLPTAKNFRAVLSAVLTNAMREDLLIRNVARLVRVGHYERKSFTPWTADEVLQFLEAIRDERLYPIFLLIALTGMRRGEALGILETDIDWEHGVIHLRQQLVKVHRELQIGKLKTKHSRRDLPLLPPLREALLKYQEESKLLGIVPADDWGLLFRDENGQPIEPDGFSDRLFHRLARRAGLRRCKLHGFRHSTATILKKLGVPDKDIQLILGHSSVSITQEYYQHGDVEVQERGLSQLGRVVLNGNDSGDRRQHETSNHFFDFLSTEIQSVSTPRLNASANIFLVYSKLTKDPTLTPVFRELHTRTRVWVLGSLAVNLDVKTSNQRDQPVSRSQPCRPGQWPCGASSLGCRVPAPYS